MSRTRRLVCLLLPGALLLAAGTLLLLLRSGVEPGAAVLERPARPEEPSPTRPRLQLESGPERLLVDEPAGAKPALPGLAEDLPAEGVRRGWQLPVGKDCWLDTLINPAGVKLQGAEIGRMQERVLSWSEALRALQAQRKQRLDAYCQERIAAGLAVHDPQDAEALPEGTEHVLVTTHSIEAPGSVWRVDVGPGDDAELDLLDRRFASTWSEAVLDLRRRFAALKR